MATKAHKPDLRVKLLDYYNGKRPGNVSEYPFDTADMLIDQKYGVMTDEPLSPVELAKWEGERPGDEEVARRNAEAAELKEQLAELQKQMAALLAEKPEASEPKKRGRPPNKDNAATPEEIGEPAE